jgi:GTP pyrophosphokinase
VRLPKGSTVLDFAYAVHSSIGDTCIGAKIRGEFVPASNFVRNVDAIEVITSKDQVPSEDWLKIVVTPKAKISIKRFLRDR